jgi:hypothetical protein
MELERAFEAAVRAIRRNLRVLTQFVLAWLAGFACSARIH